MTTNLLRILVYLTFHFYSGPRNLDNDLAVSNKFHDDLRSWADSLVLNLFTARHTSKLRLRFSTFGIVGDFLHTSFSFLESLCTVTINVHHSWSWIILTNLPATLWFLRFCWHSASGRTVSCLRCQTQFNSVPSTETFTTNGCKLERRRRRRNHATLNLI